MADDEANNKLKSEPGVADALNVEERVVRCGADLVLHQVNHTGGGCE